MERIQVALVEFASAVKLEQALVVLAVALAVVFFPSASAPPSLDMALENLGLSYIANWIYESLTATAGDLDVPGDSEEILNSKHTEKAPFGLLSTVKEGNESDDGLYYPGLVNISGTYCFMNSVLQAFASLSYLQPHIENIHEKAELWDVPTPVVDTLRDTLRILNTPLPRRSSIRPVEMIQTLSAPTPDGRKSLLFSSREHQDAQELFQLLSSLLKDEAMATDREATRELGLGNALVAQDPDDLAKPTKDVGKGVFEGLTANRRSCVECGYTEAVMHFGFDNLQLSLPLAHSIRLEECMGDFTNIELLTDCVCRKCSLTATHRRLVAEVERMASEAETDPEMTHSKKKRAREARKFEQRVKEALQDGRIEDEIKGLKMERVFSKASTKQAMIARAPPVLTLHLNRSAYHGHAMKNPCRVIYPEILDLTPFSTSGQLSTQPSAPISSSTPSSPTSSSPQRILYRLSAIVCHYGGHGFGHYVAYRRRPRPPSSSESIRFAPPTTTERSETGTGRGWLRISDDNVEETGIEAVLAETSGTFLLFYEKIQLDAALDGVLGKVEEEKVRSTPPVVRPPPLSRSQTPRIVRSVSAGIVPRLPKAVQPTPISESQDEQPSPPPLVSSEPERTDDHP